MKTRLLTLGILFVSFSSFFACKDSTTRNQLRTIHFEQCITNEREMKISEIADTVEYIELKTPKEIVIARIFNIVPADNFWVIHTPDGIFKFTQEGEFIKQIGRQGQGPDEYLHILGVDINPERKEIVQADTQGILYYDYDGNFLRKVKINDYFFNIVYAHSTLWTCNLCMHIDKYMACAFSLEGDTLAAMSNPNYGIESLNTDGFYFTSSSELREFSKYKGELFMKTRSSRDTVYRLSGPKWEPYLYFDMGKYSMPIEYEIWYSKSAYEKNATNYWNIPRQEEDDRYFYLTAVRQKSTSQVRGHEDDHKYIIYDKEKEEGFVTKGPKGIKITDDILGGPNLWPRWTTDNYYINTIEWYDLSQMLKKGEYTLNPAFQKQYDGWGYDTNQLIILCRKKR